MRHGGRKSIPRPGSIVCASLRRRNVHGHVTRAILCGNVKEKCRPHIPRTALCARLRSRNAHGHFTRAIFCGNFWDRKNPSVWPHCLGNQNVSRCVSNQHKWSYFQEVNMLGLYNSDSKLQHNWNLPSFTTCEKIKNV